jgi:hypothetical protein
MKNMLLIEAALLIVASQLKTGSWWLFVAVCILIVAFVLSAEKISK